MFYIAVNSHWCEIILMQELQYFKEALQSNKTSPQGIDVEAISKTTESTPEILNPSGPLHRTMKVCWFK